MGEAARDATTVGENDAMDLSAALAAYVRVALNLDKLDWVSRLLHFVASWVGT